jgi:hypothetical protein
LRQLKDITSPRHATTWVLLFVTFGEQCKCCSSAAEHTQVIYVIDSVAFARLPVGHRELNVFRFKIRVGLILNTICWLSNIFTHESLMMKVLRQKNKCAQHFVPNYF